MSGLYEAKDDTLEDYLMNNSFFSLNKNQESSEEKTSFHSQPVNQQTSFMTNSPSMKALESILNEKSKSFSFGLNNYTSQSYRNANVSFDKSKIETIDENSPHSFTDSTINDNDRAKDAINSTSITTSTNKDDNDDTLIEDPHPSQSSAYQSNAKFIKMPSIVPHDLPQSSVTTKSLLDDNQVSQDSKPSANNRHSMIDLALLPGDNEALNTPKSSSNGFDNDSTPKRSVSKPEITPKQNFTPSPRKSPHLRSNSAFTLGGNKPNHPPASPGKHKRSSTLNDLSTFNSNSKDEKKQKFSFKSLFKKKDKKQPSQSTTVTKSKSEIFDEEKNANNKAPMKSNKENEKEQDKKPEKKKGGLFKKKDKEVKKPNEPKESKEQKLVSSKSKDDLKKPPPSTSNNNRSSPISQPYNASYIKNPSDDIRMPKNAKSNTNINFIREVTEDNDDEDYDGYDNKNLLNNPAKPLHNNKFDHEMILEDNINEPEYSLNPKFSLDPSPLPNDDTKTINSNNPFLNFESRTPVSTSTDFNDIFNSPGSKKHDLLVGDSLFPKSLNPQEVESIVSLERSRSIKSMRSSKRNSFMNYDGSDDNVIVQNYDHVPQSPNSNVSRSNSILKNRNDSTNPSSSPTIQSRLSNPPVKTNDDEYNDLMEFSDFIDIDNLDFNTSPNLDLSFDIKDNDNESKEDPIKFDNTITNSNSNENENENNALRINGNQNNHDNNLGLSSSSPIIISSSSPSIDESSDPHNKPEPISKSPSMKENNKSAYSPNLPTPPIKGETYQQQQRDPNYQQKQKNRLSKAQRSSQYIPSPPSTKREERPLDPKRRSMSTPSSDEQPLEEEIQPLNIRSPKSPEVTVTQQQFDPSLLSPNLDKQTKTPESQKSPILNGNFNSSSNRPISMSFKGMNGTSFNDKLTEKELRVSESHQSFNLSLTEDSDYSGSAVGGGFGTSDEESDGEKTDDDKYEGDKEDENEEDDVEEEEDYDDDLTEDEMDREDDRQDDFYNYYENKENYDNLPKPPTFNNYGVPQVSSQSSSPASLIPNRRNNKIQITSPSVPASGVRFSSRIILYETYDCDEYDRHPDNATCNELTPALAQKIRNEINELKASMPIHDKSRCYTHFF